MASWEEWPVGKCSGPGNRWAELESSSTTNQQSCFVTPWGVVCFISKISILISPFPVWLEAMCWSNEIVDMKPPRKFQKAMHEGPLALMRGCGTQQSFQPSVKDCGGMFLATCRPPKPAEVARRGGGSWEGGASTCPSPPRRRCCWQGLLQPLFLLVTLCVSVTYRWGRGGG